MKICLFHDFYVAKDTEIGINGFKKKAKTHSQWENK